MIFSGIGIQIPLNAKSIKKNAHVVSIMGV